MTLKQVEALSDLSATHLSEIERGRTAPTIGALTRIARSLRRDPSYFIETDERPEVARVPSAGLAPVELSSFVTAIPLTPGIPGSELFAYRLGLADEPGAEWRPRVDPTGGEAILVVSRGTLELAFGNSVVAISTGDAVHITLGIPVRLRSTSKSGAEVLFTSTRPLSELS